MPFLKEKYNIRPAFICCIAFTCDLFTGILRMMTVKLHLRWSKQMAPMRWDNSMMCAKIQSKPFTSCESHFSSVYRYYILDSNQKWRKYLSNSFKVLLNTFCLRLNRYKCNHAFSNIIIKLLTNEYVNMYLGQPLFPLKSLLVVCCPRGWRGKDFIDDFCYVSDILTR